MSKTTVADDLAELSPEDRLAYEHDMFAFGTALLRRTDDGRVVHIPYRNFVPLTQSNSKRPPETPGK